MKTGLEKIRPGPLDLCKTKSYGWPLVQKDCKSWKIFNKEKYSIKEITRPASGRPQQYHCDIRLPANSIWRGGAKRRGVSEEQILEPRLGGLPSLQML